MADEQKSVAKATENKPEKTNRKYAREFLRHATFATCDPKGMLDGIAGLIDKLNAGDKGKQFNKELNEKIAEALPIVGLDLHYELANTVSAKIRPLVIDFARQLILEYKCTSVSEKALAEVVVGSYARILEYSESMQSIVHVTYTSNEQNGLYAIISKELDRANRHFITALSTLRQIKSPTMEVNVRAHTAIIAQNQQINAGQPAEALKADYEINKPK